MSKAHAAQKNGLWLPVVSLRSVFGLAREKPVGAFGLLIVVAGVVVALTAPLVAPYSPLELHSSAKWQGPSTTFLLGTDSFGRDVLSRVIYGARVSIPIGVAATMLGTIVGLFLGLISGYRGGWTEAIVQRWVDMMLTLPTLLLALCLVVVIGESLVSVIVAIGISMVASFTRVIRGVFLSLRETEYVLAARGVGCTGGRIIVNHILPNVVAQSLVLVSTNIGHAMVVEASLSFLGVGIQPPTPTWGQMLSEAATSFRLNPMIAVSPGIALTLMVLGFNVLGDALRDKLDPRLRGKGSR
jgi:peptide/nickel transport system permease protein